MKDIYLYVVPEKFEFDVYTLTKFFFPYINVERKKGDECTLYKAYSGNEDSIFVSIKQNALRFAMKKGEVFFKDTDKNVQFSSTDMDVESVQFKYEMQLALYSCFVDATGRELPWGNLTGIRPTKLIMSALNDQSEKLNLPPDNKEVRENVFSILHNKHRISNEKYELGADIALREDKLIRSLSGKEGYSVYIGIPFCPSTCLYCSFTSYPIIKFKDKVGAYIEALAKELTFVGQTMKGKKLDTIYIGGGTPSSISADMLDRLLYKVVSILDTSNLKEFTVEAGRPDSITADKLRTIKKYPVNRISVNPQTMNDETLRLIGRNHNAKQMEEAFLLARSEGFDNINTDMILGLPGEDLDNIIYTLERIGKLGPDSLTVHSLAIKRASKLREWMEEHDAIGKLNTDEAMAICVDKAKELGMKPYYLYRQKNMAGNLENTGFAKDGKYGLYNILIMEEVQSIIACGAGTVSKRVYPDGHIERCDTVKDVDLYISKIEEMIERKRRLFKD